MNMCVCGYVCVLYHDFVRVYIWYIKIELILSSVHSNDHVPLPNLIDPLKEVTKQVYGIADVLRIR